MRPLSKIEVAPSLTPMQKYQADLAAGFNADPAQLVAMTYLDDLCARLSKPKSRVAMAWLWKKKPLPEKGLYMWGGVGRGKTYLMDTFFDQLPFENKMRLHFHRFMHEVQRRLAELKGTKNPLEQVAKEWSQRARVLCFDEFFVSDIGDAMILATLMRHLFDQGVSLVATSNIAPQGLYKDGLQRSRFLPAIALLEQHCDILNVDGGNDYRLRTLTQAEIYHSPLDQASQQKLTQYFVALSGEHSHVDQDDSLELLGRQVPVVNLADDIVWFRFADLCGGPRSSADYTELSRLFHTVLLQAVPQLNVESEDQARRFITLVDELYDRQVKLIITAEVPLLELYAGHKLKFEFERTQSRLLEMQSRDYLALPHRP